MVMLSILVGVVLSAIGFDPWNILQSIRRLFDWIYNLGFDAINHLLGDAPLDVPSIYVKHANFLKNAGL